MLFAVTIEKLLLEAINHVKKVSKKKPTTERLLTYINLPQQIAMKQKNQKNLKLLLRKQRIS